MITDVIVRDKVLIIEFDSFRDMRLSAWRISDFYEGKEGINGKYFTIHEYLDTYLDENCEITAWNTWEGYNFPKSAIMDFEGKFFRDISYREQRIIALCNRIPDDGYVIVDMKGDTLTRVHELCHAYYFTNKGYREQADEIVNSIPLDIFGKFVDCLTKMLYIPEVMTDEIQAYLTAYDKDEWEECFSSIPFDEVKEYSQRLNILYNGVFNT